MSFNNCIYKLVFLHFVRWLIVCQIGEYTGIVLDFVAWCDGVYLNITYQVRCVLHQFRNAYSAILSTSQTRNDRQ